MANKFMSRIGVYALLILWGFLIIDSTALAEVNNSRISMNVGESKELSFPDAVKIHVSRKGIIHLSHLQDEKWKVTALKSGVVLLEAKMKGSEPRNFYMDVKPRLVSRAITHKEIFRPSINQGRRQNCRENITDETFVLATKVELSDRHESEHTGGDPEVSVQWSRGADPKVHLGTTWNPQNTRSQRSIIGDPEILVKLCEDVVIRAGGEDEVELRGEEGRVVSAWKNHGLEIKLQLQPLDRARSEFSESRREELKRRSLLKVNEHFSTTSNAESGNSEQALDKEEFHIPFTVALRTPSKGKGNYSLSDVTSSLNLGKDMQVLAAIINLKSTLDTSKGSSFLENVPIIGPFFRSSDETQSHSKLFIWFKLRSRAELAIGE